MTTEKVISLNLKKNNEPLTAVLRQAGGRSPSDSFS